MVYYMLRAAMIFVMIGSVWLLNDSNGLIKGVEQASVGLFQTGVLTGALILPLIAMEHLIRALVGPPLRWLLTLILPAVFGVLWHFLASTHVFPPNWPTSVGVEMVVWAVTIPLLFLRERTLEDTRNNSSFRGSYLS